VLVPRYALWTSNFEFINYKLGAERGATSHMAHAVRSQEEANTNQHVVQVEQAEGKNGKCKCTAFATRRQAAATRLLPIQVRISAIPRSSSAPCTA
jgi:hypothetical protein